MEVLQKSFTDHDFQKTLLSNSNPLCRDVLVVDQIERRIIKTKDIAAFLPFLVYGRIRDGAFFQFFIRPSLVTSPHSSPPKSFANTSLTALSSLISHMENAWNFQLKLLGDNVHFKTPERMMLFLFVSDFMCCCVENCKHST